jgi:hypothetical protein
VLRRAGRAGDEHVRTSFLMFGLVLVVWLAVGRGAGTAGWLAGLALVALAGASAVGAVWTAWPPSARAVSLARATIAAVAALAVLWERFAPPRWAPDRRAVVGVLGVCGALGVLAFYGLGRPQFDDRRAGAPTFVHMLDLRQYVPTAKYHPEIGYWRIYEADVLAYAEDSGQSLDALANLPVRDLRTNADTTVKALRGSVESVKERFTPERWEEYKRDARTLRATMGEAAWRETLLDLGGNATPVWMSVAYGLFNLVPAEPSGWVWLALVDPALFVLLFVVVGRTFGLATMLVCMTIFGANDLIMFGTNWAGAVLRHDWLVAIGLGIAALQCERWALGGILLGVATSIRAFPALAVVGLTIPALCRIVETVRRTRRPPALAALVSEERPTLVAGASAVATVAVLALLSGLVLGFDSWGEWLDKVSLLDAQPHANPVSLKTVIAGTDESRDRLFAARWPIFIVVAGGYLAGIVLAARGRSPARGAALGLILVPVLLFPSNYYLHLVMLLPLLSTDAVGWSVLLAMCAAQYFTTLVPDYRLHFYLSSVVLMAGLGALLVALIVRKTEA